MGRVFQVGFARTLVEGIFASSQAAFERALGESWSSRAAVTRYGRTWRISGPHPMPGTPVWTGRIGFIREGEVTTVGWDPETEDFRTEEASGGVIVPLAVSLGSGAVAFQLRSGMVRPTTFTGAFQGILNESRAYRWRVRPLVVERTYAAWRASVIRVTEARFRLEKPNPDWVDRQEVERIVEALEAEVARLEARASEGGSLNDSSDLFRQALDHAQRQYGRAVIRGFDASEVESEWDSVAGGTIAVKAETEVAIDREEIPEAELAQVLVGREAELGEFGTGEPAEDSEA